MLVMSEPAQVYGPFVFSTLASQLLVDLLVFYNGHGSQTLALMLILWTKQTKY